MWSNINIYYVRTFWIKYHNLNIINLICKSLILKSKLNIILLWNGCGSHPENSNFCQIVLRLQILECRSSSEIITNLIKKLNPATLRSDDTINFLSIGTRFVTVCFLSTYTVLTSYRYVYGIDRVNSGLGHFFILTSFACLRGWVSCRLQQKF